MKSYTLVNPSIEGTIKTTAKADSAIEAANEIYSNVSQYFATSLPNFKFTIECAGEYFHFQVEEKIDGETANYVITPYKGKINDSNFKDKIVKLQKQEGGKHRKHYDDSSSSSSSSSSYTTRIRVPISSWWYYPTMYAVTDLIHFPVLASTAVSPTSNVVVVNPILL